MARVSGSRDDGLGRGAVGRFRPAAVSAGRWRGRRSCAACRGCRDGASLVYSSSKGKHVAVPADVQSARRRAWMDRRTRRSRPATCRSSSPTSTSPADSWSVAFAASRTSGSARSPGRPSRTRRRMTAVTRQTGQVQTPSVSPDGSRAGLPLRQRRTREPVGDPHRRNAGPADHVRARSSRHDRRAQVVAGRGCDRLHREPRVSAVVDRSVPTAAGRASSSSAACGPRWGEDGRWLYYSPNVDAEQSTIEKVPVTGGPPVVVRGDRNSNAPTVGRGVLYFVAYAAPELGSMRLGDQAGSPEDGPSETPRASRRQSRAVFAAVPPSGAVEQTASGSRRDWPMA